MRDASLIGQRLVWVFALGVVLLNDPLFSLFDRGQSVAGYPLAYLYLLCVWIGLIALLAWTLAGFDDDSGGADDAAPSPSRSDADERGDAP